MADAEKVVETAQRTGKKLVIGYILRQHPSWTKFIEIARELSEKELVFSQQARREYAVITDAVREILTITAAAFEKKDIATAEKVEPLEQVIDGLRDELKRRHTERLRGGVCTMETGINFLDILTNLERVADHCSNIALNLIRINEGSFDTHEYVLRLKSAGHDGYDDMCAYYGTKYKL